MEATSSLGNMAIVAQNLMKYEDRNGDLCLESGYHEKVGPTTCLLWGLQKKRNQMRPCHLKEQTALLSLPT